MSELNLPLLEGSLAELLAHCGLRVAKGKHAGRIELGRGRSLPVSLRHEAGFLTLRASMHRVRAREQSKLRRLLELNRRLPGGAKFALDASRRLVLLADVPLDAGNHMPDSEDVCRRVSAACDGLRTAKEMWDCWDQTVHQLERETTGEDPAGGRSRSPSPQDASCAESVEPNAALPTRYHAAEQSAEDSGLEIDFGTEMGCRRPPEDSLGPLGRELQQRCVEAGWAPDASGRAALCVTLEVPERAMVARFETADDRALRARSDPCWVAPARAVCRQAIEHFLLRAGAVVRLAVPAKGDGSAEQPHGAYTWQVRWECLPRAAELDHGLIALSVACRLVVRELEVLYDETVATRYLQLQGWPVSRT